MKLAGWNGVQRGNWNGATPFWEKQQRGGGFGGYNDDPEGYYTPQENQGEPDQSEMQNYIRDEMLRMHREQEAAKGTPAAGTPAAGTPGNRAALGPANVAALGRGRGSDSGNPITDTALSIGASLVPGGTARSIPGIAQGLWNAPGEIADSVNQGNYGTAAQQAGGAVASATIPAWQAMKALPAAQQAWQAAKAAPSAWQAAKGLAPSVSSFTKAAPGARVLPGIGAALSIAGNTAGAVTGDQNYMSDGFWGQMGEQAFRTVGDLQAARGLGPWGAIGVGASVAGNVVSNAARAGGAVYDAAQAVRAEEASAKKHQGAVDSRKAWMAENDANDAAGKPQRSYNEFSGKTPVKPSAPQGTAAAKPVPSVPGEMPGKPKPGMTPGADGETTTGIKP